MSARGLQHHVRRVALAAVVVVMGCGGDEICPPRYADLDGDGFGDRSAVLEDCSAGVADARDCDDTDPDAFPGALEVCNGRDDDCDGQADEGVEQDGPAVFLDRDRDGYGSGESWQGCGTPPPLYDASNDADCNDLDPNVWPGAPEVCNEVDDDCDGVADVNVTDPVTWYADYDHDGYGDTATAQVGCVAPDVVIPEGSLGLYSGLWVHQAGDCRPADPWIHPDAVEACNGLDDDCDGAIDEGPGQLPLTGYPDRDGDGAGSEAVATCEVNQVVVIDGEAVFMSTIGGDCDDEDPAVGVFAVEVCNGIDDDCDGLVDDDDGDRRTDGLLPWHPDVDDDGYGDPNTVSYTCASPFPRGTTDRSDCNDEDDAVSPNGAEVCNGVDDDCDGHVDDLDDDLQGGPCD